MLIFPVHAIVQIGASRPPPLKEKKREEPTQHFHLIKFLSVVRALAANIAATMPEPYN